LMRRVRIGAILWAPMYTVQRNVGRLVESVMKARVTRADIEAAEREVAEIVRLSEGPLVIIADYRATKFLLEEDANFLVQMLRRYNAMIERSAILVSASSAVGALQTERVVRETKHPARRAFRDPHEAAAWLDEVLTPAERARLRVALSIEET
jgi:hypothetical protein